MSELIDNSRERVDRLAEIIKALSEGTDRDAAKEKLAKLVRETTSEDIIAMEQQLMADGMSVNEIKGMCDLHSQILGDLVQDGFRARVTPGHPIHTFHQENDAIAAVTKNMRHTVTTLGKDNLEENLGSWRELHEQLMDVEKHYARKENILFPHLERHGVTGPSQVMWAKDDDIRTLIKSLRKALSAKDASFEEWEIVAREVTVPMLDSIEEMINKEEKILFPMSLKKLSAEEWGDIYRDSIRFGFCLVEPGTEYEPPRKQAESDDPDASVIRAGTGSLTLTQLKGLLATIPVDLTFVDADDRVAFFSEGGDRIFGRSDSIIGRKVQNCHPPDSVSVVEQILSDFRSGAQDVAEFWIELKGRFIHIRYFAVRDEKGEYIGTLEATQDISRPRELTGERRLLQYGDDPPGSPTSK